MPSIFAPRNILSPFTSQQKQLPLDTTSKLTTTTTKMSEKIHITFAVLEGKGLAAKDREVSFDKNRVSCEATTSDPFVEVYCGDDRCLRKVGRTETIYKNLDPCWNQIFQFDYCEEKGDRCDDDGNFWITLKIWDEDMLTKNDNMGIVRVPINIKKASTTASICSTDKDGNDNSLWFDVPSWSATNACGKIKVMFKTNLVAESSE